VLPLFLVAILFGGIRRQGAEKPAQFVVNTSGEETGIVGAGGRSVSECQRPKPIDYDDG
jgi:hypothetical protein